MPDVKSANPHADTGSRFQLLAWAFCTVATITNKLFHANPLLGFQVTVITVSSVGDRTTEL